MGAIYHASGFIREDEFPDVRVAVYEGTLHEVANGVIAKMREQGHKVRVRTTRSLSGWLHVVHALVDTSESVGEPAGTYRMWHRFSEADEQWPMAGGPSAIPGEGETRADPS